MALWAYSIGLWHTFGVPELALFGLSLPNMAAVINALGRRIADGTRSRPTTGSTASPRARSRSARCTTAGARRVCSPYPTRSTGTSGPTYQQVIWPDRLGSFPWEPGFETRFEGLQPLLRLPRDNHPPGAWTRIDEPPV